MLERLEFLKGTCNAIYSMLQDYGIFIIIIYLIWGIVSTLIYFLNQKYIKISNSATNEEDKIEPYLSGFLAAAMTLIFYFISFIQFGNWGKMVVSAFSILLALLLGGACLAAILFPIVIIEVIVYTVIICINIFQKKHVEKTCHR